jgi:putative serine protease PepD
MPANRSDATVPVPPAGPARPPMLTGACGSALAAAVVLAAALSGCAGSGPGSGAGSGPGSAAGSGSGSGSGSGGAETGTASEPLAATVEQGAFVSAIARVLPSVVEIRTRTGLGSGVVLDAAGDIVTNAHVVGDGAGLEVLLSASAAPVPASLVGVYRPDDLAVIRVTGVPGLRPATFGDSAKLVAGDVVLAIGNPLGLSSSVTEGIVSAVGRTVSEPATRAAPGATLPDTIQTSAAINPGNSGGALATLDGDVVGIPTLAATSQAGAAAPGIGFAISSNIAVSIATQLVDAGRVMNPCTGGCPAAEAEDGR